MDGKYDPNRLEAIRSMRNGEYYTVLEEDKTLNKNFNLMIERLKRQQNKLLITERYEAWETVARKLEL